MKVLSVGWNTFHETGKHTCATVEYAGLFSYSIFKRSGNLIKDGVWKITTPVKEAIYWPFGIVRERTRVIFSNREHGEKIKSLEKKLVNIEKRLAQIEKHGVTYALEDAAALKKRKKLREDKRFVLKGILEETKALREME